MTQPTPFVREFNFTDFQAANPLLPPPGYKVDAELDGIADTLGGVLSNLALIQRDDGALINGIVTVDAMSDEVLDAIATAVVLHTKGADGSDALPPEFTFSINTLSPGAAATINVSGTYPALHLTLGIPKGDPSPGGANLIDADYGDVLVSGSGSVLTVQTVGGTVPSMPGHVHSIANVTGLQAALDGKAPAGTYAQISDITWANLTGKPATYPPSAHTHTIANVTGLQDALDGKQAAGTYATTAQLAAKADAITAINSYTADQAVSDATHNGTYNRMTGSTGRTITFGTVGAGHCSIWVNRGTVNMTIACAGGYYKNGASASAVTNLTLAPGGRLTAFHEGAGVWAFDGSGF